MPFDTLVVRESHFNALKDRLGLVYREIERTGKVVYEWAERFEKIFNG